MIIFLNSLFGIITLLTYWFYLLYPNDLWLHKSLVSQIGIIFLELQNQDWLTDLYRLQSYGVYCSVDSTISSAWDMHRIFDVLHLMLTVQAVYTYIVTGFGDLPGMVVISWYVSCTFCVVQIIDALRSIKVWSFYTPYVLNLLICTII